MKMDYSDIVQFFDTPPMTLTAEQINDLCLAHCNRVVDNMDMDDLVSYAVQQMMTSFDRNPGQNDTDLDMLIEDIWVAEGEDEDSTTEFLIGAGIDPEVAEKLVNEQTQFEWLVTLMNQGLTPDPWSCILHLFTRFHHDWCLHL